ncbi:MAG: peptide/nickel transport system permease protein [Halanaerobium sp. 4-GBenrich]|uniref:Peptide/nickel transport system permease protein n=1 Tax=Halanaerobium congolense TaxID=54121 RepID=A0A1G6JHP6_9FIRM|nr:ABC transporter permease [Halanaerobium congolense]ODS50529.1 MAG: peptide/nickel transport system permease protein [Halanaerobium sp. 4-GBenrich]SDC18264.1 peptide/nickel transport system permease protein [Halanaerobium congolense]SDH52324.1 peptide/nickel transport system permease protein [Halanaerobium congolense]SDK44380.1 peptide/nickel transport system permease protein [Halanaerobium congolense]SDM75115.1 peptide/nickel transport system permease protein [Halanaerobium congolense]
MLFLKKYKKYEHSYITTSIIILIILISLSLFAPLLTDYNPVRNNARNRLQPPSKEHLLGTDQYGRDIFTRILYGLRTSIEVGISVVILTVIFGGIVGIVAGYYPQIDKIIMRVLDAMMAFPGIIIAISLAAIWGAGKLNIILALSFAYFPKMARIIRSAVISIKDLDYVDSARAAGANDLRIIFKYILKNSASPIMVQATFNFALAILDEAALSFLGVGIMPPAPSLGAMVTDARTYMVVAPWMILAPGMMIILSVLSLNLLGDGMRDLLDPHLKNTLKK